MISVDQNKILLENQYKGLHKLLLLSFVFLLVITMSGYWVARRMAIEGYCNQNLDDYYDRQAESEGRLLLPATEQEKATVPAAFLSGGGEFISLRARAVFDCTEAQDTKIWPGGLDIPFLQN